MFPGIHQKVILVVILISLLAIIELNLINNDDDEPNPTHGDFYYINKQPLKSSGGEELNHINNNNQQQSKLQSEKHDKMQLIKEPHKKVKQTNRRQPPINQGDTKLQHSSIVTSNPVQQLVDFVDNKSMYKSCVKNLSSSQTEYVLDQMGISNLTLQSSRVGFLLCGRKSLLKQLKGKQLNSSLNMSSTSHHCKNMSFKSSGPSIALASYPGSGNSWVRQLLESATGIYTGAEYCDPAYVAAGMIGEHVNTSNVLAVKTHTPLFTHVKVNKLKYDKAIYIVRSPFDAILAEHSRLAATRSKKLRSNSHTAEVSYNFGKQSSIAKHYYIL